ncbi:MAG: hypothetical protein ACRCXZ_04010, partial [Patescibacteria group bacterium]
MKSKKDLVIVLAKFLNRISHKFNFSSKGSVQTIVSDGLNSYDIFDLNGEIIHWIEIKSNLKHSRIKRKHGDIELFLANIGHSMVHVGKDGSLSTNFLIDVLLSQFMASYLQFEESVNEFYL